MSRRIAINTGGGDAPGLNAVIRSVVLAARWRGWEVFGIRRGYQGLLDGSADGVVALDRDAVRGITHVGGSILGSSSRGDPFRYPVEKDGAVVPSDESSRLVERFVELGFDALVAVGGDGSLAIAARLLARGLPRVIAVPKTIDNDLAGTDVTFGFHTAVATACDALDRVHTTAQAHDRVMVVEVMGRYTGWIALYAGLAGSADVILIPEVPYDLDVVCEKVRRRDALGRGFSIVVVAEGAAPRGGDMTVRAPGDEFRDHAVLGGVGERVAREIAERTGKEARTVVLGHLQRGGSPITYDRVLGLRLGSAAVHYLAESRESGMVAVRGNHIALVRLDEVAGRVRRVPADSEVLRTARDQGVCFGDEPPGAFFPLSPGLREP